MTEPLRQNQPFLRNLLENNDAFSAIVTVLAEKEREPEDEDMQIHSTTVRNRKLHFILSGEAAFTPWRKVAITIELSE